MSVQAISTLEPERLVRSGGARHHSTRLSGGKTLVPVDWLHVPRATCDRPNPCKKSVDRAAGPTNGRIRLKLSGPIANTGGPVRLGGGGKRRRWSPLHTRERHVNSDFIRSLFAQERLVRLGQERQRSTQADHAKTMARFPTQL